MLRLMSIILFLFCISITTLADTKLTMKNTVAGNSTQSTTYIKGSRQRMEQGAGITMIYQCDNHQMIQLNTNAKKYFVTSLETSPAAQSSEVEPPKEPVTKPQKGGIVTFIFSNTDTGERKEMFGHTARHIKTTMSKEATPNACDPENMQMEMDGWYIDFEYGLYCSSDKPVIPSRPRPDKIACKDEIHYKYNGSFKLGFPVILTTTINTHGQNISTTMEVVEFSTMPLDASLFEVPAGYTKANSFLELFGSPTVPSVTSSRPDVNEIKNAIPNEPKQPGTIRVGVVSFSNKSNQSVATTAMQEKLINDLEATNIDAVQIIATNPPQVEAEAVEKGCDYIVYTDIAEVKKPSTASKIGGLLGRAKGADIVKEKYEVRIDYKLLRTGNNSPILTSNATAKEEGAVDVSISAALEREAKAVLNQIQKK